MSFFEIKNISCIRGNKLLFKNLNFKLKNQELLVIKGANGSGKTTLLKILSGLLKPLSGSIIFDKKNINTSKDEYLKLFEYIGHENAIKNALTVRENLNFYLKIKKNLKKENFKNAILSNIKIWFLDEPTNSLDKKNTLIFFKILNQHLKSNGIAVIASHDEINIKNKNIDLTIN